MRHALDNYLMAGGLPETFAMNNQSKYVRSLLDAIINKDICNRYKIRYKKTLQQITNGLLDRFCQELLWNGEDMEVIEPVWLRKEMAGKIKRMWNKYKEDK